MSHEEYQQALREIVDGEDAREASRLFFDLVANDYPRPACETRASAFHERLENVVDRVERLDPPPDAVAAQREFLAAGRESVDRIGTLAEDVAHGDLACGRPYNERAYGLPSTDRAVRALEKLERRGYFIFGD